MRSPQAVALVMDRITWWQLDGRPFFDGETEACHQTAGLLRRALFRRAGRTGCSIGCSTSSSRTAAGTARRRQARDRRSIPRSACSKGFAIREGAGADDRGDGRAGSRRALSAGAPHAEVADIRRGDRSPLDALLVPVIGITTAAGLDYLRAPASNPTSGSLRVELVKKRRTSTGDGDERPSPRPGPDSLGHGNRDRQGQPLEHAARPPRAGLVWELSFRDGTFAGGECWGEGDPTTVIDHLADVSFDRLGGAPKKIGPPSAGRFQSELGRELIMRRSSADRSPLCDDLRKSPRATALPLCASSRRQANGLCNAGPRLRVGSVGLVRACA